MRVPRIHEAGALSVGQSVELGAANVQHLVKALRLNTGDPVVVFNGDGHDYHGDLQLLSKKAACVHLRSARPGPPESPVAVHIGLGMSLGDRMEFAIQKATEAGVTDLAPLETERSELRLKGERAEKKQQRWQQVAISAAQQCGRATVPTIHPVQPLSDWIQTVPSDSLRLVLHHGNAVRLADQAAPQRIHALIGPEGGLSPADLEAAERADFIPVVLGPRVLRTETAPVALLASVQTLWGDY